MRRLGLSSSSLLIFLMAVVVPQALFVLGFHPEHVDDMQCVPCNSSTYCTGGQAYACPANSFSDFHADSSTVDDCTCVDGFNRTGDVCYVGLPPYYWKGGILQLCPANMKTISPQADSQLSCVCDPGYEPNPSGEGCLPCGTGSAKAETSNGTCVLCLSDTFSDTTGLINCKSCTENASSGEGALACLCDAGYVSSVSSNAPADGSACVACPATFYRENHQSDCKTCGHHMLSPPASDSKFDCLCDAGYYFNGVYGQTDSCLACPVDTFKGVSTIADNEEACNNCPANTSSPEASVDITNCECLAGYEAAENGFACTPCFPGTNKSSTGVGSCTPCPVNTFSDTLSTLECSACMESSTAPEGSDSIEDCICDDGKARIKDVDESLPPQCSDCQPGKYSGSDDDGFGFCFNCTGGTFSDTNGATSCETCPANASSVESPHVECQCKKGYKCSKPPCTEPFSLNFYGNNVPSEDQQNKHGSPRYMSNFLVSYLDMDNIAYLDTWVNNVYGSYPTTVCNNPIDNLPCYISEDQNNEHECKVTDYYYYRENWSTKEWEMITRTGLSWYLTGCNDATVKDYFFEVYMYNGCREWRKVIMRTIHNKAKLVFVSANNINSYLTTDNELWYNVPEIPDNWPFADSEWPLAQNEFYKFNFLQGDNGNANCLSDCCVIDQASGYQSQTIRIDSAPSCSVFEPCPDGNCESCPSNTYSNVTTSTLQECFACQDNSESPEASESQHACHCVPGYYEKTDHECESCLAGKFSSGYDDSACVSCSNGLYSNNTASTCSSCPLNSFSHDSPHVSCQCNLGHYCAGEAPCPYSECIPCPGDTFSDVTGDDITCQQCQLHSTSPEGSVNQDACQCKSGHFVIGPSDQHECAACPPGTFADSLDATECQVCTGEYVYTPPANLPWDASNDCVDCELCGTDEYDKNGCSGNVSTSCEVCPVNSGTLHDASKSNPNVGIQSCSCDIDYYGPLGGSCTLCHATQVRPEGRVDQDTTVADCQCFTGLEPHASGTGELCSVCNLGFYKDTIGNTNCTACPATFTTQFNQSLNSNACVCQPGYKFVEGDAETPDTCEICPENTYKSGYNNNPECVPCSRENAISLPGSATDTDCLCKAAYFDAQIGFELTQYYHMIAYDYYLSVGKVDTRTMEMVSNGILSTSYITLIPWFRFPKVGPAFYEEVVNDGTVGRSRRLDNVFIERPIIATNMADCDEHLSLWKQMPCRIRKFTYQNSYFCQGDYCDRKIEYTDYVVFETWVMTQTYGPGYNQYTNNEFEKRMMVGGYGLDSNLKVWTVYFLIYNDILSSYNNVLELQQDFIKIPGEDLYIGGSFNLDLPLVYEKFSIINGLYQGNPTYTGCSICPVGYYKNITSNDFCTPCPAEHYNDVEGALECIPCPVNMVTNGSHGRGYCYCNVGQIPVGTASTQDLHTCEDCETGKFKDSIWNSECKTCSGCPLENERIIQGCSVTLDDVCGVCQDNSNLPFGESTSTFCNCNAGYEADEDNDECVPCDVGKYRNTNSNNSISCQTCPSGKFTDQTTTIECLTCTGICAPDFYVSAQCTASSDIECSECTTCQPGHYSRSMDNFTVDLTCGVHNNNGRTNTVCTPCEANFYCEDAVRKTCKPNSISEPGSFTAENCTCAPGFYANGPDCIPCERDHYCPDGALVSCPLHSFNNKRGSEHLLDCNCHRAYYRIMNGDESNFTCPLCEPGDFCFNNTAFNCSDDRMVSDEGSFRLSNCTCVNGFYNNVDNTACIECPFDTYCMHGLYFNCSSERHHPDVQGTGPEDCLCKPGSIEVNGVCEACPVDVFCEGDEIQHPCPVNSKSPAGSDDLLDCKCEEGFSSTHNSSSLSCHPCAEGFFKDQVSNTACQPCMECSVEAHDVYEYEACRSSANAVCSPCTTCTDGFQYISTPCQDKVQASCTTCTTCSYPTFYTKTPCRLPGPYDDTECEAIEYDLATCAVGRYRGQHTTTSNSFCAPCLFRDTPYIGYTLHEATSFGQIYNDAFSCPIRCLGNSKMRNPSNQSLGCVSCETGNVLLKEFQDDVNDFNCSFTCKAGYEKVVLEDGHEDCFLAPLTSTASNTFTHTVKVTNIERDKVGFKISVLHSNHSRFLVVVGPVAPNDCRSVRGCCYDAQWRVSTLSQAGFPSSVTDDGCSKSPSLNTSFLTTNTLQFSVPDSLLPLVGSCIDSPNATVCEMTVSIIDTLLWGVASERISIRTERAAYYAVIGEQEYIPMNLFHVNVFLGYLTPSGESVYIIQTRIETQLSKLGVKLRVLGMTQLPESEVDSESMTNCVRSQFQSGVVVNGNNAYNVSAGNEFTSLSFWKGSSSLVQAYYTLNMAVEDLHGQANDMDVVAMRDMTDFMPLCTYPELQSSFDLVRVNAFSGLGASSVYAMNWLSNPTQYVRGELGTLSTFIVQSLNDMPISVSVKNALAVYIRTNEAHNALKAHIHNATTLQLGILDFNYDFRALCRAQGIDCAYEYLRLPPYSHAAVHALYNCSQGQLEASKAWIKTYFGVPNDDGHLEAICSRMQEHPERQFTAFFINTMSHVNRNIWGIWHDTSADDIISYIWTNFKVVT